MNQPENQTESKPKSIRLGRARFSLPPVQLLLVEVFSIVLGIWLALSVSEWNDERRQRRQAGQALVNIVNEFQTNYNILSRTHKNNSAALALRDSLGEDSDSLETTYTPVLYLQKTAWETMLSTGITNNIEYETLLKISQVYSIQELYMKFGFLLVENQLSQATLLSAMGKTEDDVSDEMILEDIMLFLSLEQALVTAFKNALDELGDEGILPTVDASPSDSTAASDSSSTDGS